MTIQSQNPDLQAALAGDHQAFSRLIEPHRHELTVHCYRMLGSIQDAEDMVQETMLRAWQRLSTFEGRAPLRAWAYKIATNACLDAIDKRKRRTLPMFAYSPSNPAEPFKPFIADPIWMEPLPGMLIADMSASPEAQYSMQESVSMAFLTTLQVLPARQRAILILRDVLGWRAREVAHLLDITVSAANSALFRARATLKKTYTPKNPSPSSNDEISARLDQYIRAWEDANINGLVQLLHEDAVFEMPPSPSWYDGKESIRSLFTNMLFAGDSGGRWILRPASANGAPAFALYQKSPTGQGYLSFGINIVRFRGNKIAEILHFLDPGLLSHFNLPATIEN